MLFWYYTFSFVRKVLLRQCCFVSALDNKKVFFFKPIFGSHWANRNNISLKSDDKVKTKIRKTSEKIIPVRRKRVEACLTPNWEFSSIPTLNSKFINQIVYTTSPYKHLNLSCSQQSFQFFFQAFLFWCLAPPQFLTTPFFHMLSPKPWSTIIIFKDEVSSLVSLLLPLSP